MTVAISIVCVESVKSMDFHDCLCVCVCVVGSSHFCCYAYSAVSIILQVDVQIVTTEKGLHFFDSASLPVKCHTDDKEWVRCAPSVLINTSISFN